jgi:hypothetical protein
MRCPAVLLALCAALPCCGCLCVYNYTSEESLRASEPKRAVQFQSETAARLFCTTVNQRMKCAREEPTEEIYIPLLTSIIRTRKLSEAAFYNDQVAVCDTNGDGFITDAEAVAYHRVYGVQSETSQDDSVLVQTGYITLSSAHGPYEIFYPRAYASPPELTFPDVAGSLVDTATLEQTAQGFRVHLTGWTSAGMLKWRARGVPAPGGKVPAPAAPAALGAPAPEAPAAGAAVQAKLSAPADAPGASPP